MYSLTRRSTHQTNFHPSLWHISLLGTKCESASPSSQDRIATVGFYLILADEIGDR